jgi:hypothetical protein
LLVPGFRFPIHRFVFSDSPGTRSDKPKGSRKNKFSFFSAEAPVRQDAKAPEYFDISSFRNAARQDASALINVKLFLREPCKELFSGF